MNGIDTFLDINNAHLRVNNGNVQASTFVLDQINIVTSANTATTVNFNNVTKAFNAASNIEVGTANLFVDTTTSNVGIGTDAPAYTLDVHGSANVGALTATTFSGSGAGLNSIPSSAISGTLSQWIDINTNDIHYSAGNVGIGKTPDSGKKLDVDGTVKATTFEGEGSALTALNAANIATGTLDVARVPTLNQSTTGSAATLTTPRSIGGVDFNGSAAITPTTFGGATFSGDVTVDTDTFHVDTTNDRVGIGTTSPLETLDTYGTMRSSAPYPRLDFYTTTNRSTNVWGNSTDNAGDYRIYSNGDASDGTKRSLNFDYGQNTTHTTRMAINANGNVGIGTTTPHAKLQVNGQEGALSASSASSFNTWANGGNYETHNNFAITGISIHASHDIVSGSYIASHRSNITASDERIKKDIVDLEDGPALETLRLLKPKRYKYKDVVRGGTDPVWGFIAQEVRETLSYATQLRQDSIPNIYEMVNISTDSSVITFTNFDTSTLESGTKVLKVFDESDTEHFITFTEVIDDNSLRIEEDLSKWTQLFVYGQRVDDFVFVQKDAIWTVATAALQEVDRQLQAEKARNDALEARIATLENTLPK
jgi:hypothetical protein